MSLSKTYKTLGHDLMESLLSSFQGAYYTDNLKKNEYKRINLASGLNVRFKKSGEKPYYIIIYHNTKYLLELDLSRIIETNKLYTWYLNLPTRPVNRLLLDKISTFEKEISKDYLESVSQVKLIIAGGKIVPKSGYCVCNHVGRQNY